VEQKDALGENAVTAHAKQPIINKRDWHIVMMKTKLMEW
jgi:hypothetical protein